MRGSGSAAQLKPDLVRDFCNRIPELPRRCPAQLCSIACNCSTSIHAHLWRCVSDLGAKMWLFNFMRLFLKRVFWVMSCCGAHKILNASLVRERVLLASCARDRPSPKDSLGKLPPPLPKQSKEKTITPCSLGARVKKH
eukprot:1498806-Amphidinium_carterae.1